MPDLHRDGIGCTLFTTPAYPSGFGQSGGIRLRWSEQELLSLLDSAVAVSRGPVQRLLSLGNILADLLVGLKCYIVTLIAS